MSDENFEEIVAPELRGLSSEEVAQRLADGLTNAYAGPTTKSVGQIVAEHTFTLFNGVNLVLAGLVAITGAWRNLSYTVVVFANLFIGVFQEIRSKRTIDRLSILAERPVVIRRDGRDVCVSHEQVVLDDLLAWRPDSG